MQLSGQRLTEQLPQELRSLYSLHGDEALLLQEAADAIRATARQQGFSERHVFTVAGAHFDWSEVESAASAMSLFADKQLIDIRIPSGKPGKEGSEALQRIAAACVGNDGILVLLSLPRLDKTAKSSGWFTALDAHGINRSNEQGGIGLTAAMHPKSSCGLCGKFHEQRGGGDRMDGEVVFEKPQAWIEMPGPDAFVLAAFKGVQKTESGSVRSEGFVHFSSRE